MRLSAFSILDEYPPSEVGARDRLHEVVSLARVAETAGLSAVWVAEHHFHSGGVCPQPPVLLAAMAAATARLRLGVLVSVLPLHNPVEVAEQYAMVDRLSNGRLNLGFGSGYIPQELEGFGVAPDRKRALFDQGFETTLEAMRGLPVRAASPPAPEVRLNVRPVQTPHPPVWIAVQRREAIPFVARRGVSVALIPYATLTRLGELAEEVREFRENLPAGTTAEVAVALHLYAGPEVDRARSCLQRYLESRLATQSVHYAAKAKDGSSHGLAPELERQGWAILDEPRRVADKLEEFRKVGVDEVLGIFDFGGLPPATVGASVAALGAAMASRPAQD